MHTSLLALGALAGAALADNMGKAVVMNNCNYPIHLCNVPASGAGFQQVEMTLASGKTYEQTWTKIGDVQGGWSIKLTKGDAVSPVLQYEYTCKEDGVIWYDLSEVDGNPWSGQDWEISANDGSGCDPKQAAYRFWNDDEHGMQSSCPQSSVITVTLCSKTGNGGSGSGSGNSTSPAPASQPAPAYSPAPAPKPAPVPAPATSSAAPAPTYAPPPTYAQKQEATTLATSNAPAKTHVVATTVIEVETVFATAYVTVAPKKRHVHHPHHNHA